MFTLDMARRTNRVRHELLNISRVPAHNNDMQHHKVGLYVEHEVGLYLPIAYIWAACPTFREAQQLRAIFL